ncbi:hypothetical protein EG349_06040 [Chryseobacterium shandongense]|uniref:Uncharacterized protein YyaB-like PH domain-containing protein n=1 Tax=Chryseobacterium shandongense TaxID=1493872 RepID=A0AAD0YBA2_9FLAO|nr:MULTISPECIES: PH domain-containing protein [Chryseobacterium]AZA86377.1 hypothetical protein EG349_06040 [Chryseobacterium shandongense]AZA94787.1 hypothetical protein EG353_04055 [Chryseobacterium shandongense]
MKNIPVRIGWELYIPIFCIVFFPVFSEIKNNNWEIVFVPLAIIGIILFLTLTIRYRMDSDSLYIKNSIFGTTKIRISEIYKIEKTSNMISSPAPAISGRVEIYYKSDSIVISPKDFTDFEQKLLAVNPDITVKK